MATQVQFRRGTSAQNSAFTGAAGELTVNTDKDSLVVHDGSTQGGFEVAKGDLSNISSVGILTATSFSGDGSTLSSIPTSIVAGDNISVSGSTGAVTITGLANTSNVSADTLVVTGISTVGIVTGATSLGVTDVYATTLYGNGSNLTGITAGATLSAGSGSQRVVVTSLTSGTMTSAATDAELTYNSGTNALTATSFVGALTGNADTATTSTNVTVADESSDTTCFPLFATAATGNLPPKSGTNLTFNSSSGQLTATSFSGDGSSLTGIDASAIKDSNATVRAQANTSGVVVTGIATATTFVGALTGNVTGATSQVTVADESSDTTCFPLFTTAATGNLPPKSGTNLTFNSSSGALTATSFVGALTGNVTGNTSGTAGGLSGAPSITVADITATGNVSIAGTLTYEDVTSIDAVGLITARTGVRVTTGGLTVSAGGANITGNIAVTGTVDGRDVATDGTKLDGIEASATADQTAAEIRTLVGSASDSNVFTDADHSKLDGIEASATADQTAAEIRAAVEAATDSNVFTDADHSKLNGIASGATNVTNNNQLTNGAGYVTSNTQLSDEQVQDIVGGMVTGNTESGITVTYQDGDGTIDFSVASQTDNNFTTTLKNKLDGIASGATNVTNNNQLTNGAGYVTSNTQLSDEQVQDIVGAMVSGNSESGITVTYQDGDGTIDFSVASQTDNNFTTTLKNKLDGIASGATNVTNNNQLTNGAGYITSANGGNAATLDSIDSSQFLRSDAADQKTSGTLRFNDNVILSLGSSDDAEFFVNGSHLYLDLNSGIGNFYIRDGTTTRFTFDDAGSFTATSDIIANSDIRLKTNIQPLENSLEKVNRLRGVSYDRVDIEKDNCIGVIAQEVEEVYPEFVSEGEDGTKGVDYSKMVAVLIEAVKEQQKQISDLKDEIKSMKG